MNEAIFAALCADTYTDPLTLGPFPGIVDSVDVTVQAAAVFAQMYRSVDTGVQALDDREYLLLPGSRTIDNVTGIRFRNQIAGIPAIVTASLGGPDIPQIGPVFADTPLVGSPLLIPTPINLDVTGAAAAFSGVPPAGYGALLIRASNASPTGVSLYVTSQLPGGGPTRRQLVYLPGNVNADFTWVIQVPAASVEVGFMLGTPSETGFTLGVWPTNLPPGTYNPPIPVDVPIPVLYLADNLAVANGVTSIDLAFPFVGPVDVIVGGSAVANLLFSINLLHPATGFRIGFEVQQAMAGPGAAPGAGNLVPGRHQIQWNNATGVVQHVFLSVIGRYAGVLP